MLANANAQTASTLRITLGARAALAAWLIASSEPTSWLPLPATQVKLRNNACAITRQSLTQPTLLPSHAAALSQAMVSLKASSSPARDHATAPITPLDPRAASAASLR